MYEEWEDYCANATDVNAYPECFEIMHHEVTKYKTLSVIFLAILIMICVTGNILVCTAFIFYRRLRVITHYYIFSLAVSDLLVGLLSMPTYLSFELTGFRNLPEWIDEIKLIKFMEFIDIISCISSIVNLAAISVDRFFGIVMPLRHKTLVTEKTAVMFICIAWMYSLCIAGAKFIPYFQHYIIFNFVAGYIIPLLVICGCYLFIFITVKKHAKKRLSNQLSKEWTLAKTISIVISLFVICWTPFFVIVILYQYCLSCTFFEKPWFDEHVPGIIKWLHYFNSCCNPFVYGVFNINFRTAYKAIIFKCLGRISKDYNANAYETSVVGRYSSVRQRSNTVNSVLSYTETSRGTSPSISSDTDELLCLNTDKVRTSSFTRTTSTSSIIKLPKPLTPTNLEEEPRLFLKQKFQKQSSLEQYSPKSTDGDQRIFDQIAETFNSSTMADEYSSMLDQSDSSNLDNSDSSMLDQPDSSVIDQLSFVETIQNSTLIEIDSLLADAKESNI